MNRDQVTNALPYGVAQCAMQVIDAAQHHRPEFQGLALALAFLKFSEVKKYPAVDFMTAITNMIAVEANTPEFQGFMSYMENEV